MPPSCRRRRISSFLRFSWWRVLSSSLRRDDADLFPCTMLSTVLARPGRKAFSSDAAPAAAAALSAHARRGAAGDVVREVGAMRLAGVPLDERCLAVALSSCARLVELRFGRRTHGDVVKMGFGGSAVCQGSLLNMYAKCGRLDDARRVFDGVDRPDAVSWTAMIGAYVQAGRPEDALHLFDRMRRPESGAVPDEVALVTAVTACVHLGRLAEARALFHTMPSPGCIAWNAIISGHARDGSELEALAMFREMLRAGVEPTRSTLGSVLSAAANLAALGEGRQVHGAALRRGLASNVYVGSSLISLYAKCQVPGEARLVFDAMPQRNLVSCNAMLAGHAQSGLAEAAAALFSAMRERDACSFVSLFCAAAGAGGEGGLSMGKQLHGLALKAGYDSDAFVGNSMVDFYGKCGDLGGAARQLELLPRRDAVSWNALMVGQARGGREGEALRTFLRMRRDGGGAAPDAVSLAAAVGAAAAVRGSGGLVGEQVHGLAVKLGLEASARVGVSLVDLYGKLGDMDSASKAFVLVSGAAEADSAAEVPSNALIAGYARNGDADEALRCFRQVLRGGLPPSAITLAAVLPAGGDGAAKPLHAQALRRGLLRGGGHVDVGLVAAYLRRRGGEGDALRLLAEVPVAERGLVIWTAAVSGLAQAGSPAVALTLFGKMMAHGVAPDESALASALGACADLACLRRGTAVHAVLARSGFGGDEHPSSALVDMYAKCGDMGGAARAFEETGEAGTEQATSWNAMIAGLASNGRAAEALALFRRMAEGGGPAPDAVTFLAALTACSHAGLVEEAGGVLDAMAAFGVSPRADHVGCVVDLLARGGHLAEAEALAARGALSDPEPAVAWGAVASGCSVHGDGDRGARAAEELMNAHPLAAAPYLLLLRMRAECGDWDGAARVRDAMAQRRIAKTAQARSWLTAAAANISWEND
ncbi:pentatricopeptide repeat-containing protein At3g09040, mitochondrial-like [Wolffia australiana]